jgi:dihydrofolate reductase
MGKLVVFEWMSFDGVFDADTMSKWWEPYDTEDRRRRILETYSHADALLMGRVTYEMLAPYWSRLADDEMSGLPGMLNHAHKYVVSSRPPGTSWQNSTVIGDHDEDIKGAIGKLRDERAETVCIGSGTLVTWLMQADLVDEYKFLVQPVIAGNGKRLFTDTVPAKMQLVTSQELDQGVLFLHYQRGVTHQP